VQEEVFWCLFPKYRAFSNQTSYVYTHTFAYLNSNKPAIQTQEKRVFLQRMRLFKGLSTHLVEIPDICDLKKRSGAWMVFIAPWIKRCQYLVTLNSAGRQAFHLLRCTAGLSSMRKWKTAWIIHRGNSQHQAGRQERQLSIFNHLSFRLLFRDNFTSALSWKPVLIPTKKWKQLPFYFVLAATNRIFILCRASFWKNIKKDVIPF